jgi:hypothetical protein
MGGKGASYLRGVVLRGHKEMFWLQTAVMMKFCANGLL